MKRTTSDRCNSELACRPSSLKKAVVSHMACKPISMGGKRLFEHRGRMLLIGDHKDKNLGTLVRTRIARRCMDRSWWLVKRIAGFLDDTGLPIDRKFDHSLQDVSKRVVSRMAMP